MSGHSSPFSTPEHGILTPEHPTPEHFWPTPEQKIFFALPAAYFVLGLMKFYGTPLPQIRIYSLVACIEPSVSAQTQSVGREGE